MDGGALADGGGSELVLAGTIADVEGAIDGVFAPVADFLLTTVFYSVTVLGATFPLIVGWLVVAGIVYTLYFRGIQLRGFRHGVQLARGRGTYTSFEEQARGALGRAEKVVVAQRRRRWERHRNE